MRAVSPKHCWLNAGPADELRKPIYTMVFAAMHPPILTNSEHESCLGIESTSLLHLRVLG